MNICFVSNCQFNEYTGGIDRVCVSLIKEMHKRGHRIVCVYGKASIGNVIEFVLNKQLPNPNINSEENIDFLKNIFFEEKIDVVLDNSYAIVYHRLLANLKKIVNFKLITIQHNDPFFAVKDLRDKYDFISYSGEGIFNKIYFILKFFVSYYLRYRHVKQLFLEKYGNSDCYVVLSNGFANKLRKKFSIKDDKLRVVYNPIDSNLDDIICSNKKNQILFVGRLDYQKRVDRLLYIWKELYSKHCDWNLIIVGDGEERERLENLANRLCLQNYSFVGEVESKQYMRESKICCLFSSHEAFSMVLVEAQIYWCVPVAYNSYETLNEIMPLVDFGLKIKPFHKKEYIQCLDKLMSNEKLLYKITEEGRKNIHKFDVVKIVDEWEYLFHVIKYKVK